MPDRIASFWLVAFSSLKVNRILIFQTWIDYRDQQPFSPSAIREARSYGAAAASHLRIIAEEVAAGTPQPEFSFYSIAWTALIRDALISAATGRALD